MFKAKNNFSEQDRTGTENEYEGVEATMVESLETYLEESGDIMSNLTVNDKKELVLTIGICDIYHNNAFVKGVLFKNKDNELFVMKLKEFVDNYKIA